MNKSLQKLIKKVASKRTIDKNTNTFRIYETYRKAVDIIERADLASGKGTVAIKSGAGSTLNFEVNRYGVYSTTAKEI